MRCFKCEAEFVPQFLSCEPTYNMHTQLWHKLYYQYCPKCHVYIVGIYEYCINETMFPDVTILEQRLKICGCDHTGNGNQQLNSSL